jgi:acyl-CoA reductase-like NAD-dependent aldehyde dehydrogenase
MRERANAWSVGDVERLRSLAPVERASACIGAFLESSFMRERGYADMPQRLQAAWVAAAAAALERNAETLAILPVEEILKPNGYVAQLKARGYVLVDP